MYGFTGASGIHMVLVLAIIISESNSIGRHCCLWCSIVIRCLEQINQNKDGKFSPRSLHTIKADSHLKGDLKVTKLYNITM